MQTNKQTDSPSNPSVLVSYRQSHEFFHTDHGSVITWEGTMSRELGPSRTAAEAATAGRPMPAVVWPSRTVRGFQL